MTGRYSGLSIAFHWLTAALVLAAFLLGPGGSEQRVYSGAKDFDRNLHEVLGLSVFALTLLRLAWRPFSNPPELHSAHAWMNRAAKAVGAVLYILLVATPLAGISGAWLEGHPLTLGMLGEVPPLLPEMHSLGKTIAEVHGFLGDTLLWTAGLHAAAALLHHFVLRDDVLVTMLPFLRRLR